MQQRIAQLALVVKDYDEAIAFYSNKLLFRLVEDTVLSATKRWVVMAPPGNSNTYLLLAKAANERQLASVGNQTGGRVFLFLHTDDLLRDETFGKVAVFEDLYGTLWDMIEPTGR